MSRVLICAGGTGGHVFPALAVAEVLRAQGHTVSWLGTTDRMEAELVPKYGFTFIGMRQQALRGGGKLSLLAAPWRLWRSIRQAKKVMANQQPDLVLGFGGYTAGPAGIAARLQRVPLVIHEQNAIPGLTNRLLARVATRTLLGFSQAQRYLAQGEWVGNPVRAEIVACGHQGEVASSGGGNGSEQPLRVLVIGGSLGAAFLNQTLPAAVAAWAGPALTISHQAGKGNSTAVRKAYGQQALVTVQVSDFITDMAAAYAAADVVVCRAGALTVAELACAGKPALLVPYPYAVDDHQTANGQVLSEAGAALIAAQRDITPDWLQQQLQQFALQREQLSKMGAAALSAAMPAATASIVAICNEYIPAHGSEQQPVEHTQL